jgi:hypothetical protein
MQSLTTTQFVVASVKPVDREGNPAPVDGLPVWTNSNPNVVQMDVAVDGFSATFTALIAGVSTVSVSVDADLGEGTATLAASDDITVTPAGAVGLTLSFGTPQES